MSQGKLRGKGLRGEVQSTLRESYGGAAVLSNFKSRVVHPRNPKLVKGRPEDDKVMPWLSSVRSSSLVLTKLSFGEMPAVIVNVQLTSTSTFKLITTSFQHSAKSH